MFAWMLVVFSLAAFTSDGMLDTPSPEPLGLGVTVTPADGWEPAGSEEEGSNANIVSLRRAGAQVVFAADSYEGSARQLLDEQLDEVRAEFGSFRSLPPGATSVGDGVPALRVLFSGTSDSGSLEGELVAATTGQTGVVMLALAPFGQIARVQRDIDRMLRSVSIPQ